MSGFITGDRPENWARHPDAEGGPEFEVFTGKRQGPKAVLVAHVAAMHRRPPPRRATLAELQEWHATQHHRLRLNHFHAGPNLGPGDRPPGWRTGEGAVERS